MKNPFRYFKTNQKVALYQGIMQLGIGGSCLIEVCIHHNLAALVYLTRGYKTALLGNQFKL